MIYVPDLMHFLIANVICYSNLLKRIREIAEKQKQEQQQRQQQPSSSDQQQTPQNNITSLAMRSAAMIERSY